MIYTLQKTHIYLPSIPVDYKIRPYKQFSYRVLLNILTVYYYYSIISYRYIHDIVKDNKYDTESSLKKGKFE